MRKQRSSLKVRVRGLDEKYGRFYSREFYKAVCIDRRRVEF